MCDNDNGRKTTESSTVCHPPPPISSSLQLQNGKKDFFALFLSVSTLALDYQYILHPNTTILVALQVDTGSTWNGCHLKKKQFDNEFGALVATIHWYFHVGNHANTDAAAPAYYFKASYIFFLLYRKYIFVVLVGPKGDLRLIFFAISGSDCAFWM